MGEQETYQVAGLIRRLHRNSNYTIVLIEHDMRVVFNLADRITVLDQGKLLADGTPAGDCRRSARAGGVSGEGRMNALEAEGLNTYYGKSHILHDVGLIVAEGQITTLLGRNGAGKTTTLTQPDGPDADRAPGTCGCSARKPRGCRRIRIAAMGVGYVPEGRRIFPNLTVDENLHVPLERPGPWTIPRIYQLFPRLAERKQNRGRQLSGGEQEMLSIARALLINPRLLILDEPSQGLAPLIVREVFRIVAQMRADGISVLLVEQNVRLAWRSPTTPMCWRTARSSIPAPLPSWRRRGSHPGAGRRIGGGVASRRSAAVLADISAAVCQIGRVSPGAAYGH